jgi:hypothetical protein
MPVRALSKHGAKNTGRHQALDLPEGTLPTQNAKGVSFDELYGFTSGAHTDDLREKMSKRDFILRQ